MSNGKGKDNGIGLLNKNPYTWSGTGLLIAGILVSPVAYFILALTWLTALGISMLILAVILLALGRTIPKLPPEVCRLFLETGNDNMAVIVATKDTEICNMALGRIGASRIDSLEDRRQMQREAFLSDIFLSGANAVTLDGKIVNVDYLGNRTAATLFGPKKVIIVAGVNKIVANVDEAMDRIRRIAAPTNARRHYQEHHYQEWSDLPCVITGQCVDCRHDSRICSFTVIIESTGARDKGRINLVLIGEELGV